MLRYLASCLLFLTLLFSGCGHSSHHYSNVTSFYINYYWTSPYDGVGRPDSVQVFVPEGRYFCPVMVFHRGRGFDFTDYTDVLRRISSEGVVCVSVADNLSFSGRTAAFLPNIGYDVYAPASGMESASYAQEEALHQVLLRNQIPDSSLFQTIDTSNVYFAGHSRGGGATEFCQSRHVTARGFIYYMPFNIHAFYPYMTLPALSPTKSLVFSATLDGNLGYDGPAALVNEMTGPTQLITITGGNHDYMGDFNMPNANATITREQEHEIIVSETLRFIR